MRILKTRPFAKDAKSHGLSDESLIRAIREVRDGLIDADLGGHLVKKRIAVGNRGKSAGLRSILVYSGSALNIFCVYLYAKNEVENVSISQLQDLKDAAEILLELDEDQIQQAIKSGNFEEVRRA